MNTKLRDAIIEHVFANFAIIPSSFVNLNRTASLLTKEFLLSDGIPFAADDGKIVKNKVWGCQLSAEQQEIKILIGDCTQEQGIPEYCLLIHLKNSPAYGAYLVHSDQVDSEPLLACTMDGKNWLECPTYLQATFLAAMEQIRDVGLAPSKCTSYKEEFDMIISLINFHDTIYGSKYEGQES